MKQNNCFLKWIALMLVLALIPIFSIPAFAYRNIRIEPERISIGVRNSTNHTDAVEIGGNTVYAQRISSDKPIHGVSIIGVSYNDNVGNIKLTILPWKGELNNSIYGKPIASKTFENFADGGTLSLFIDNPEDYSKDILFIVSEGTQKVGIWTGVAAEGANQTSYLNGSETGKVICSDIYVSPQPEISENLHTESRSAYEKINMLDYDYSFGMRTETVNGIDILATDGQKGDSNIRGYRGNYSGYAKIDFGKTAPKSVTFDLAITRESTMSEIQLYIDGIDGKKIGESRFLYPGITPADYDKSFFELNINLTENVTGVHDVYVVYGYPKLRIKTMQFSAREKDINEYDKLYADFKPVEESTLKDISSDTWSATDMLGRRLPGYETVGPRDEDRQAIMFTWINKEPTNSRAVNINERARLHPDKVNDYHSAIWDTGTNFYNESVYGYASNYDEWMIRKQLELMAAAGIDAMASDNTNSVYWHTGASLHYFKVMHEMMKEGYKVPKMTYMFPFFYSDWTMKNLENIYLDMYETGLYSDCWYYWDGKPVLMAYPESVASSVYADELMDYFTFRPCQPEYTTGQTRDNMWPWLEAYPQNGYVKLKDSKYNYECVSVGIAQNMTDAGLTAMNRGPEVYGRSFTYKDRYEHYNEANHSLYGYNFQEQWERAFELNPKMVFITGWNEYTMGRYESWYGAKNAFPDAFNDEYSRDIEPIKGELQDVYYYQLVANMRRFKGVNPTPVASAAKTIDLAGDFAQWNDVGPEFHGYKGGTEKRDFTTYGIHEVNETGRNDIVLSKVARDDANLYFYVETAEKLSPCTDEAWMRLFINADRKLTGWEGYDYVINRVNPENGKAVLEKAVNDTWEWEKVGDVSYTIKDNKMMIELPRSMIAETGSVDIEFKWNDNMQTEGNIMDFYVNGDTAPIGRFAYRYTESTENDEEIDYTAADLTYNPSPYAALVYNTVMALNSNIAIDRGEKVMIDPDNPDVTPKILNDKTMVPLRFLAESMDAKVDWDDIKQAATITYMGTRIRVIPGNDEIQIEKNFKKVQTAPQEIDGRIYIPLRDIVEALGTEVYWIDPGIIIIGTNAQQNYVNNAKVRTMVKFWYDLT